MQWEASCASTSPAVGRGSRRDGPRRWGILLPLSFSLLASSCPPSAARDRWGHCIRLRWAPPRVYPPSPRRCCSSHVVCPHAFSFLSVFSQFLFFFKKKFFGRGVQSWQFMFVVVCFASKSIDAVQYSTITALSVEYCIGTGYCMASSESGPATDQILTGGVRPAVEIERARTPTCAH